MAILSNMGVQIKITMVIDEIEYRRNGKEEVLCYSAHSFVSL